MDNPYREFLERYSDDPAGFAENILKLTPQPWQRKAMEHIARGARRLSIAGGHGCGKSSMLSWLIIHYLLTRFPCKIVVTAPSQGQLFDALGAEVKRWIGELPESLQQLLTVKMERIELTASPAEAFCAFKVSRADSLESLQGVHSENVLLVCDESSGIPDGVFEAAYGSMSGENASVILIGNPLRSQGYFFETHHTLKNSWVTMRVSCLDSPMVSQDFIKEMRDKYGEESNQYRCRVLAHWPKEDDDLLIPRELVEKATKTIVKIPPKSHAIWGVDVARMGRDKSIILERISRKVTRIWSYTKLDLMTLAARIERLYKDSENPPKVICIDSIGLGSGVHDRLKQLGLPVMGVNVSESAAQNDVYFNLRSELWFRVRDWLKHHEVELPNEPQLVADLCAPRFVYKPNGTLGLERKEETAKRLAGQSPDFADALILTFYSRDLDDAGNYIPRERKRRRAGAVC